MKKLILSASFAFALLATSNTFAQQGFGTNKPDKSAAVDIVSSKRGLLIPRVALTSTDSNNLQSGPIANPAHSLFVYNTATAGSGATAVTPGFYYWERDDASLAGTNWAGKWVRFTSTNNERDVIVQAAANGNIDIPTATYDANGVKTYNVSVKGGVEKQVLVSNATGGTVWVNPEEFISDVLTAGNAIGIVADPNDPTKVEVKFNGTLTEDTTIATGAYDLSITGLDDVATANLAGHEILIMDASGLLKKTTFSSLVDAQDLTLGDGLAFEAGITGNDGVGAVLKATKIEIEDKSVEAVKLDATGATAGHVATVNSDGTVSYKTITPASLTGKEAISTDGIIVVGADALSATANTIADAVLTPTYLKIADESITSTQILNGTIQPIDMQPGGNTTVLVTAADGTVSWIDQSALGNKDAYTGVGAINIAQDTTTPTNANGGLNYNVSVATATGTTLGVVKEAATAPTVNIDTDGELSVNRTHTLLAGDVTGPLSATVVGAIQGTAVSATAPTATNNVLVYDDTADAWVPTELTGSHITGSALTSSSITVTPTTGTTNTALLEALTLEIKPGTTGQVLTTTGAVGSEVATWAAPNTLVDVRNGINKDNDDYIELGGDLMRATTIGTSAAHTLAIKDLEKAPEGTANKVIVAEEKSGVLRTVDKVVTGTNVVVDSNPNYSIHTPEVVINVTLPATGDQTITFPDAADAVGQVINIKIANDNENHTGYLNVLDTYGSMPYQGWIVKSNGSAWVIVGRN